MPVNPLLNVPIPNDLFSNLTPVCPNGSSRYKTIAPPIVGSHPSISAFSPLEQPSAIPVGWYAHVQPEGASYFYNPFLRIVTPSDVCLPGVSELIVTAFERITSIMRQKQRELNLASEIYIELGGSPTQPQYCYYLIDHNCRIPYWITDITPDVIGLEPFSSEDHLKSLLNQEYWLHVEHFPMHNLYPLEAEDELICILADSSVSPASTAPYGMHKINDLLQALLVMRTHMTNTLHDGYRLCALARLWLLIARARHINTYGLWKPHPDRLQSLDSQHADRVSLLERLSSTLELGTATSTFESRLHRARQGSWPTFSTTTHQGYRRSRFASLVPYCRKWAYVLLSLLVCGVNISISLLATENDIFAHLKTISSAIPGVIVIFLLVLHSENQLFGANIIIGYMIHVENYDYNQPPAPAAFVLQGCYIPMRAILIISGATGIVLLDSLPLRTLYPIMFCGALPVSSLLAIALFFSDRSGSIGRNMSQYV